MKIEEVIEYLKTLDAWHLKMVFKELADDVTSAFWEAIKDWR